MKEHYKETANYAFKFLLAIVAVFAALGLTWFCVTMFETITKLN